MHLNSDFREFVFVDTSDVDWQDTDVTGIQIKPLELFGGGANRETVLSRYLPGAKSASHTHRHGQEFFVLDGWVKDEFGRYPIGTYSRIPTGQTHSVHSDPDVGCLAFVKNGHVVEFDQRRIAVAPDDMDWASLPGAQCERADLASKHGEVTCLARCLTGAVHRATDIRGGVELFMINGTLDLLYDGTTYRLSQGCWARFPHGCSLSRICVADATYLLKTGHLPTR